jgi:hypothetical protein
MREGMAGDEDVVRADAEFRRLRDDGPGEG